MTISKSRNNIYDQEYDRLKYQISNRKLFDKCVLK